MQGFSLHIQQSWIRYILPSYQAQLLGFHSFLQLFAILPAVFALGGHPRGVCHVASRSTRFQNPLDFNWISDFRSEFWISKWISGFHWISVICSSEDTAKIYSWTIMNHIPLSLDANRIQCHRHFTAMQHILHVVIHTHAVHWWS